MRISDWSSDVCSSDLVSVRLLAQKCGNIEVIHSRGLERTYLCGRIAAARLANNGRNIRIRIRKIAANHHRDIIRTGTNAFGTIRNKLRTGARGRLAKSGDRKSVVSGKSVSVRLDLGGRRIIQTKKHS